MSSILEALKKLEADKNAQQILAEEPEPVIQGGFSSSPLLSRVSHPTPRENHASSITLVLAGGIFAVLLIGVSVLLAIVLMQGQAQRTVPENPGPALALIAPTDPPMITPEIPADAPPTEAPIEETTVTPISVTPVAIAAPATPPKPPRKEPPPAPVYERAVVEMAPPPADVRYEPYIPESENTRAGNAPVVPNDIRQLPMLTRNERDQYRLNDIKINMLNVENDLRPLGNAIINLEKVFIGETLPGTNARLVAVENHGIAIEILSTRQQYYIRRR